VALIVTNLVVFKTQLSKIFNANNCKGLFNLGGFGNFIKNNLPPQKQTMPLIKRRQLYIRYGAPAVI